MLSVYPACFFEEEVGYSVIFPDLNWLATQGDTLEEAMESAVDCLAGYIFTSQEDGEELPTASSIENIDIESIRKELELEENTKCFVNLISVDVKAYAKEHF